MAFADMWISSAHQGMITYLFLLLGAWTNESEKQLALQVTNLEQVYLRRFCGSLGVL